MRLAKLIVTFSLAGLALALAAQASSSMTVGGSIEARPFARYAGPLPLDALKLSYGQATSLGLELAATGTRARAAASIEAALLSGAAASDAWTAAGIAFIGGIDSGGLVLAPAFSPSTAAPQTLLEARIRALYLKLDWDWISLTVGRQVVKYQRGALWSPTDPFTELDLSGISPVRRGADALRLILPIGDTGTFDLVAAPKADIARGRYAARLSGFFAEVDAAALGWRDGNAKTWNLGGDFKADLVLGWNGVFLYSRPDSGSGWIRASGGADYSFGDFILAAEYYYNGGGAAADPRQPGSHNAYAAISWKASDFLSFTSSLIDGISTETWSAVFSASLDAAQNARVALYAKLGYQGTDLPWLGESGLDIIVKF